MPEELRRPAAAVQTSSQLAQVVRDEVQKVHAWYRNLQAQQLQRTQALVLEGRPQEALLEMREANVLHSGVMRERCERDARALPSLPPLQACAGSWGRSWGVHGGRRATCVCGQR
jgi:hypothetical protein